MGSAQGSAAAAQRRSADAARGRAHHARAHARVQLVPVARRRHRHLAFRLPACRRRQDGGRRPDHDQPLVRWASGRRTTSRPRPSGARCTRPTGRPSPAPTTTAIAHFMFPFITLTPNGFFEDQVACTLNVPMDDTHTMTYNLTWKQKTRPLETLKNGDWIPGLKPEVEYLPNTNDWFGRWRLKARPRERLPDRPRHAEERQLHRHPGHRPAGSGDDRMHGRGRRSQPRASRAVGPHDRHHPQAAACRPRRN